MAYKDYLSSKHWRELRKDFIQRHESRCFVCSSITNLHVHHRRYKTPITRENILGKEKNSQLVVLCNKCHSQLHAIYGKTETKGRWLYNARRLFEAGAKRKEAFLFCNQDDVLREIFTLIKTGTDNRIKKYLL